ncbi:MAG TPA: hypothetical protein DD727_05080 [Clostridiales bacterium]|nr:hypothetical protein [Clostridiales bacterium]
MRVVGFIGASGTGKSYRASWVAREKGLEFIIDDGLLIRGNQIVAGSSAKKEATRISAIKRALFIDPSHVRSVMEALARYQPEGIMILGTSDSMVESIAARLGLSGVDDRVYINEVASEYEISQALLTRKDQGKHVIPVPTFAIRKDFSGYLLDPLNIFRRKGRGIYMPVGEKSVVRPTFSYMGNYTISEYALRQIVEHAALAFKEVNKVHRLYAEDTADGKYLELELILIYGCRIRDVLVSVQAAVSAEIARLTGISLIRVDVIARSIVLAQETA